MSWNKRMQQLIACAACLLIAGVSAPSLVAEEGAEGCGEVQNFVLTNILGTYYGHSFGDHPGGNWNELGEAESNHDNAHNDFAVGLHNHADHPSPCEVIDP